MTRISILVPLYNAAPFIEATIESILAQSYTDWEALILDDCSTDGGFEVAQALAKKDQRIKVLRNEKNLGMMGNWNKGLDLCRNEFFVKLDADDRWHPQMLADAVEVMDKHPQVGLVFCNLVQIDEKGEIIEGTYAQMPDFAQDQFFSCVKLVKLGAERMLSYDMMRQGIALTRRKAYDELGYYLEIRSADTELYFRIGCHYDVYGINKTYYYWRQHPQSDTQKIAQEGTRPLFLYQLKNAIIDYYFKQGKISQQERKESLKSTQFLWNTDQIYRARLQKKYGKMLRIFVQTLWLVPIRTLLFYVGRFWNQITTRLQLK